VTSVHRVVETREKNHNVRSYPPYLDPPRQSHFRDADDARTYIRCGIIRLAVLASGSVGEFTRDDQRSVTE
jgi:hypothetical protein